MFDLVLDVDLDENLDLDGDVRRLTPSLTLHLDSGGPSAGRSSPEMTSNVAMWTKRR
jgi:hypothetical protein